MPTSKRTPADIRADIKSTREQFIGVRTHRVALLEDALEQKRADVVADRIISLEAELAAAACKP